MVLLGFLKGKTSLEACSDFDKHRLAWFQSWFGDLPHGIPDPTTVSRALSVTNPQAVIIVISQFFDQLIDELEEVMSLDGKAIHACQDECMTHMLSLFSSMSHVVD